MPGVRLEERDLRHFALDQRIELAGSVERDQFVATADMLALDENLRDGRRGRWCARPSAASLRPRNRPRSHDNRSPWRPAVPWRASNRGKRPWYRFRSSACPLKLQIGTFAQRIKWVGRTTRAQLTSSTLAAPARFKVRAQASAVLPVVRTSSTRMMVRPSTALRSGTLKAPATAFRRCSGAHPLQRRRALDPADQKGIGGNAEPARNLARDERRLIESPPPQAGAMQRNRDQHALSPLATSGAM